MKSKKTFLWLALMLCITAFLTACRVEPEAKQPEKENLLWDTRALFTQATEVKEVGAVELGERITSFKFKGAPYQDKQETWVFAAIGIPDATKFPMPSGGYPAVLAVHGGGGQVFTDWITYWTDRGFVCLAPDMFSNQLDQEGNKAFNSEGGPTEDQAGSIKDSVDATKNSWVYHSVYNIIACHNYLRSQTYVNQSEIGLTGISWGGVVTNIVSGVDWRFAAFAPVYGSGYLYEDSFWIENGGSFGGFDREEEWIALYDASAYLPYNTKPTLFVSGIDDPCFSVEGRQKSYDLVKGDVFFSQRSDLPHGYTWEQTYEVYAFFRHALLGEDTLTAVGETYIKDGLIYFTVENKKCNRAYLVYTTSTEEDSHKWSFTKMEIAIDRGCVELPDGITAYVIEFAHDAIDEGYRLSTEIVLVD